jgi:hypothetical protein
MAKHVRLSRGVSSLSRTPHVFGLGTTLSIRLPVCKRPDRFENTPLQLGGSTLAGERLKAKQKLSLPSFQLVTSA